MIRSFIYLLVAIFLIIFVRAAAGVIGKAIAQLFEPGSETAGRQPPRIELKKDPVCGIYVSSDTKVRKTIAGREYYFCSESCRDRFKG